MARSRRPSIPLIILFIILLLLFLFSGTLVDLMSRWAAQGSFTYNYTSGTEAIVSITYTLPQDLADAMAPEQVEGWTATLEDNILSLTDGTLNPGESVTIGYRLTKYIKGGTRTITANGTTIPTDSSLHVPEVFPLALAGMLHQNAIWLLVLAIIVLVIIIVLFILGKKKDEEHEQKEE